MREEEATSPTDTRGKVEPLGKRGATTAEEDCCGGSSAGCCAESAPASGAGRDPSPHRMEAFEPAMCCATGVCGPSVDPTLVRFAGDLEWLESRGVHVARHNLYQDPQAFTANAVIRDRLNANGPEGLPIVLVDGCVTWEGDYPTRSELASTLGLEESTPPRIFSESVKELVALGAAIVANCEPCFRSHYDAARKLGISREDLQATVETARAVKEAPGRSILQLADRYLGTGSADPPPETGSGLPLPVIGSRKCC